MTGYDWLTHHDDRVWSLVKLGLHMETDTYSGELDLADSTRIASTFLPHVTAAEIRGTLADIAASLDWAHRAEHEPVKTVSDWNEGSRPFYPLDAGEALVESKRAEAFTDAELLVSLDDARAKDTHGHKTRVISEPAVEDVDTVPSIAVCTRCNWRSPRYYAANVARAVGQQHEREASAA